MSPNCAENIVRYLHMKKLLGILVLGLLLSGCNQNRNDEYICNPTTTNITKSTHLKISKDKVKSTAQGEPEYTYDILEEKYDRIVFGYKSMGEDQIIKHVFYKKTKIYKWHTAGTTNSLLIVYNCQKMN